MVPSVISVSEVSIRYGAQTVLDRATLSLAEGERVGLVGRNGSGKTSFLRILVGELAPDAGTLGRRRDRSIGYGAQKPGLDASATVWANALEGARRSLDLIAEYERTPSDRPESAWLFDRIAAEDGWNLEPRLRSLLNDLRAPAPERLVGTLSGGEARRVALCRALLGRPELLLLDEPTNHLDPESIAWLEDFLSRYRGTCLFVTHDRYFLDRVATRIVELSRGQFLSHEGNYTDYLIARAERQAVEDRAERVRQKFLKSELAWVRKNPSARRTKSVDRVARYFELAAQHPPEAEIDVELVIPPAPPLGERVIEAADLAAEVDGRRLFNHVSFDLRPGERLGVIGRNGVGKSTLLKLILGQMAPASGKVVIGPRSVINHVDQQRTALDDARTVWEEVGDGREQIPFGEGLISTRGYLRRFLFTDERINSKVEALSGGERRRVLRAKIRPPGRNVLILDEPTNDLDLGTLRLLEEALVGFPGSAIVVSHDRYFLNRVCTSILAFEEDGSVQRSVGNYDYYLEKRAAAMASAAEQGSGGDRAGVTAPGPHLKVVIDRAGGPRRLTWKEARELEGMERAITEAEAEVSRLETLFADPDFFRKHGAQRPALERDLERARLTVERLYARWGELEAVAGERS